jgi:ubiquinone/menaquinone biosynthesis C-methylase UbiE
LDDKKPKYGWYVKNLVVSFTLIGLSGIILLVLGFLNIDYMWLLMVPGLIIVLCFLWPGLGMLIMNIILLRCNDKEFEMPAIESIKSPQVLDVGCGTGRTAVKIAKLIKNGGHLTGIDIYNKNAISGNALDTVQKNAKQEKVENKTTFQYGSVTEIPFENSQFDIVNASSVLHEIHGAEEQYLAFNEIYRVLKPEGYFYLGEWHRGSWQLILYTGIFCFVFKNKNYWLDLAKRHQFKIQKYSTDGGFSVLTLKK